MEKLLAMLNDPKNKGKGLNGFRLVLLLAVVFLYPKIENFDRRLMRIEMKLWPNDHQAQTTHESTNVFPLASSHRLQIHAD